MSGQGHNLFAGGQNLREQRGRDNGMQDDDRPEQKSVNRADDSYPSQQDCHPSVKDKKPQHSTTVWSCGLAPNSSRHGTSGTAMKMTPTTISSHAAAMTMYRCITLVSLTVGTRVRNRWSSFCP